MPTILDHFGTILDHFGSTVYMHISLYVYKCTYIYTYILCIPAFICIHGSGALIHAYLRVISHALAPHLNSEIGPCTVRRLTATHKRAPLKIRLTTALPTRPPNHPVNKNYPERPDTQHAMLLAPKATPLQDFGARMNQEPKIGYLDALG